MQTKLRLVLVGLFLTAIATTTALAEGPQRVFVSEAEVVLDGRASSPGVLTLRFEPNGGEPVELSVDVADGTKARAIAAPLTARFAATLGATHDVKQKGSAIVFKAKKGSPPFHLAVSELSAMGVSVQLTR